MKLLTNDQRERLLKNGRKPGNHRPVVKLSMPDGTATWLLSEIDQVDPDLAYGLCDLGMGFPELGYVRFSELAQIRGKLGLPVERDLFFRATKTVSAYTEEARRIGYVKA